METMYNTLVLFCLFQKCSPSYKLYIPEDEKNEDHRNGERLSPENQKFCIVRWDCADHELGSNLRILL